MFIKVKRALYSASCIYSSHTHTQHPHTHTHTFCSHSLSPSLALLLSQAVCPHGNEGCSNNNNNNDCKVINTLCKTATKKKNKKAKHSAAKEKKKTKAAKWVGQGCQSGWVGALALGACLFLCRVVTAAASSSFRSLLLLHCRCLGRRRCC